MKIKNLILIVSLLYISNLSAQNLLFVGDKSYKSTSEIELPSTEAIGGKDLDVTIGKNGNKGVLKVSTLSTFQGQIVGTLLVYLDNGSVIKCIDRKIYDQLNNIASTVYYLTAEEINKLKKSNINSIRFDFNSNTSYKSRKSYSVSNNGKSSIGDFKTERVNFPQIIRSLF